MTDVATEVLSAALHREEMRKALLGWFKTAKRRSGNGKPSVYNKEDFPRLTASIVAASKADAMIESHMRTVMTVNPLLAAALWMELLKLIKAVYEIGGLSEISDSAIHLVKWSKQKEAADAAAPKNKARQAAWAVPALELAKEYVAAKPDYRQVQLAKHICKRVKDAPDARQVGVVISRWIKNDDLSKPVRT